MVRGPERSQVSAGEYLAWEREQREKHEFFDGRVYAMSGGSMRHNALCARVIASLQTQLGGCTTLTSDQRVAFPPERRYSYPDVSVVCGKAEAQPGTKDVLINPSILIEVLSRSTEDHDRGDKWAGYQTIATLTDYVLISQQAPRIEHFRRNGDGSWTYRNVGPGERIELPGAELVVDTIFARVFELAGDEP